MRSRISDEAKIFVAVACVGTVSAVLGLASTEFQTVIKTVRLRVPTVVIEKETSKVPACDPSIPGEYQIDDLRTRVRSGVELTGCDFVALDNLIRKARLSDRWAEEAERVTELQNLLTECNWGLYDYQDCVDYDNAGRLDDVMTALLCKAC